MTWMSTQRNLCVAAQALTCANQYDWTGLQLKTYAKVIAAVYTTTKTILPMIIRVITTYWARDRTRR